MMNVIDPGIFFIYEQKNLYIEENGEIEHQNK